MNIPRELWSIIAVWYKGMSARVKWNGELSGTFRINQGTGQGRTFSPEFFKAFTAKPLELVQKCGLGAHIGRIHIPSVVFADDSTVLTDASHGQEVINIIAEDGDKHRYNFGVEKTKTIIYKFDKSSTSALPVLKMQGIPLLDTSNATHMGILHTAEPLKVLNQTRVSKNVKSARGALYALFGAGMHGRRGLTPAVSKHLWSTFITPILTYGAEVWQLKSREYEPMELFQRKALKCLQSLPENTANIATLGLLGVLPTQYLVEAKALNLFVSIIRDSESLEFKVALRQLGMKDSSSASWFVYVQDLLHKYNLRTVHHLLADTPSRTAWKEEVKRATRLKWLTLCQEEVQKKRSLRYISPTTLHADKVSMIWDSVRESPSESHKASVKAKFLTGTYRTQACRAKFNQTTPDLTCQICHTGPETREHVITACPALSHLRAPLIDKLFSELQGLGIDCSPLTHNHGLLMQCLMDATHASLPSTIHSNELAIRGVEKISRDLIYVLHSERWRLLQRLEGTLKPN